MRTNMRTRARPWLTRASLLVPVFVALLLASPAAAQYPPAIPVMQGQGTLKVMTYNMYVGTDYDGIAFTVDPTVFMQAVNNVMNEVRAGNPPARAQEIAEQIAEVKPDLVSLQEVATWSTGTYTGTWSGMSFCSNLKLEFDYRQLLLDALEAQGTQYKPVATYTHFTVDAPISAGACVRNTWSIVVLARADLKPEELSYSNVQTAEFVPVFVIPMKIGYSLSWPRGWISVDVHYRGKKFRFIAPHLDSLVWQYNVLQGLALLAGPADTSLPVVIAGDLNANAANPSDPTYLTYTNLLNGGFVDAWTAAHSQYDSGYSGYTQPYPSPMNIRSDLVLVRGRFQVPAAAVLCRGSDHCGVVARLQFPDHD